jgi:hypothetical protein
MYTLWGNMKSAGEGNRLVSNSVAYSCLLLHLVGLFDLDSVRVMVSRRHRDETSTIRFHETLLGLEHDSYRLQLRASAGYIPTFKVHFPQLWPFEQTILPKA